MKTSQVQFWPRLGTFLCKIPHYALMFLIFTALFIVTTSLGCALVCLFVTAFTLGSVVYAVAVVLRLATTVLAEGWVTAAILFKRFQP
jgi:hypothetical protein